MKKFMMIVVVLLFATSTVASAFAAGGKNHGDVGKGTVSTGDGAQGSASQPRTGR